jgi:hypothetical protein
MGQQQQKQQQLGNNVFEIGVEEKGNWMRPVMFKFNLLQSGIGRWMDAL